MHDDDQPAPRSPAPVLSGRQRQALRGKAHRLEPVVQVGQAGVTGQVLRSVDDALAAHELIKVRLHQPEDKRAAAQALADGSGAVLCGLVGHTAILYRPDPDEPRITLES
jgi:RNA-binding protein